MLEGGHQFTGSAARIAQRRLIILLRQITSVA
jgi:hypothetical protein